MTRTQRQQMIRVAQYGLLIVVAGTIALLADWGRVSSNFFNLEVAASLFPGIITVAARNTVLYTVLSFVLGLSLGLVLALMRLSQVGLYRALSTAYIEVFRGLPALLTIFLVAFGVPLAFPEFRIPSLLQGVLGLGLVAAAYMAETIRAGIQAVPDGQVEAARSLGMSSGRALVSIVIPQAFRIIIPPLTNEFVLLIKDTSLFFIIGVAAGEKELTKFGRDALSVNSNATPLIVAGAMYLIITIPMTQMVAWLERRQQRTVR